APWPPRAGRPGIPPRTRSGHRRRPQTRSPRAGRGRASRAAPGRTCGSCRQRAAAIAHGEPNCNERRGPDLDFRLPNAGAAHGVELLPEVLHLVAEPRRVLEPEILRRLVHLLLEGLDQALELLGRHLGVLAAAPPALRRGRPGA